MKNRKKKEKKETKKIRLVCRDSIYVRMRQHRGIAPARACMMCVCVRERDDRTTCKTQAREKEKDTLVKCRGETQHEGPPHFTPISLTRSNVFLTRDKRKSIKHT